MAKYSVVVVVPQAGLAVDRDLFEAAGYPSDGSGCCMMTGDRDHAWYGLSLDEAQEMKRSLEMMLQSLNELNGRDLGSTVEIDQE